MSLEQFFVDNNDPKINVIQTLSEKIKQRRIQLLVHSYLYYELDSPVISDDKWQKWADELVELQKEETNIGFLDDVFEDWSGATGCHLPFNQWVIDRANCLLGKKEWIEIHRK